MTNGMNEPCSASNIHSLYCLFFSRLFISYALVSSWLLCRWVIGLNTLISKNARCLEIQNSPAATSTRASSMIFAVLSCSDSPVSCWSIGLINTSWHMIFRRLAVRYRIWLWRRLIKPAFLQERAWSMVRRTPDSQVVGGRCSCHPYRSRSRSQKQFLLMVQPSSFMERVVSQVDAPCC